MKVLDLLEERLFDGPDLVPLRLSKTLERFARPAARALRRADDGRDVLVSTPVPIRACEPLAAQAEDRVGLRACGDLDRLLASKSRHADRRAERGLCVAHRPLALDIGAAALEERMFGDLK